MNFKHEKKLEKMRDIWKEKDCVYYKNRERISDQFEA